MAPAGHGARDHSTPSAAVRPRRSAHNVTDPCYKPRVSELKADRGAQATRGALPGVAVITLAKAYFLVTGFAQPILLTRFLGTRGYGLYGVVLNVVSILNNVVVAGSIQSMSRAVTEGGSAALRRGVVLHAVVGVAL